VLRKLLDEVAAQAGEGLDREVVDACIPEGADLKLALPVKAGAQPHPKWGAPLAATLASLPKPLAAWQVEARGDGQQVKLALTPPDGAADPGVLHFFPFQEGRIEASSPQTVRRRPVSARGVRRRVRPEGW